MLENAHRSLSGHRADGVAADVVFRQFCGETFGSLSPSSCQYTNVLRRLGFLTYRAGSALAGCIPDQIRPWARRADAGDIDKDAAPALLAEDGHNRSGAVIQALGVDADQAVEFLLGDFDRGLRIAIILAAVLRNHHTKYLF